MITSTQLYELMIINKERKLKEKELENKKQYKQWEEDNKEKIKLLESVIEKTALNGSDICSFDIRDDSIILTAPYIFISDVNNVIRLLQRAGFQTQINTTTPSFHICHKLIVKIVKED